MILVPSNWVNPRLWIFSAEALDIEESQHSSTSFTSVKSLKCKQTNKQIDLNISWKEWTPNSFISSERKRTTQSMFDERIKESHELFRWGYNRRQSIISETNGNLIPQFKNSPMEISRAYPYILIPSYVMLFINNQITCKGYVLVYATDIKLSWIRNTFNGRLEIILTIWNNEAR